MLGSWMQYIAIGWLTFKITQSPQKLGLINLLGTAPLVLTPIIAPTLINKISKKKLLLTLQILFFILSSILTILSFTRNLNFLTIAIFSFLEGLLISVDQPLKQTIIPSLVMNKDNLPNALAWSSFSFNFARIIAPSVAGIIIMISGSNFCFLIDTLSFITMIFIIQKMKWKKSHHDVFKPDKSILRTWKETIAYINKTKLILYSFFLLVILNITVRTYTMLMPVISQNFYFGDAELQGYLLTSSGFGAVIASIFLTTASKDTEKILARIILFSILCFFSFFIFSNYGSVFTGLSFAGILGGSLVITTVSLSTLIQLEVEDEKRISVISLMSSIFLSLVPISNFFAASMAELIGIQGSLNILLGVGVSGLALFYYKIKMFTLYRWRADNTTSA